MAYLSLKKYEYIHHGGSAEEYRNRFNSYDSHKIGVNIGPYPAFFIETLEIRKAVLNIHKAEKKIIKLCDRLPTEAIDNFIIRCLIDEIQITNDIEGVQSTRKEISDAYEKKGKKFNGIVEKYSMIMSNANIPLNTCEDIRSLYDDLVLQEVLEDSEDNRPDGMLFRKDKVYVSSRDIKPVHSGLYPENKIIEAMTGALNYLNDDNEELLYRISVFHYLIGYIHPFYDGNGRLNRFISSYMLTKEFESVFAYRLSYTIKENQLAYHKAFKECNDEANYGELTVFVKMFLDLLTESIDNLNDALYKRKDSLDHFNSLIKLLPYGEQKNYDELYRVLILNELFSLRGPSINELAKSFKLSEMTIRKMIKNLQDYNILKTDTSNRKFYYGIDLSRLDSLAEG